jgi:molybdopterin molybdotransferase
MAQLSDDCFAFGGAMLSLAEAEQRMRDAHGCVVPVRRIALRDAIGRILAEDVSAPIALPRETNSAVDGYAIRHADLLSDRPTLLPLHGRTAAGHAPGGPVSAGFACRIFTGAIMPEGADTVMMQEDCELTDAGVLIRPGIRRGANRRPAGEDVPEGATALHAGRRLMPPDIGLLAALGFTEVTVRAPVRVALFSTGDELLDAPAPLGPGKSYDANRHMLAALLARLGAELVDGGILPDSQPATRAALRDVAADFILTSGGVSTGEEDHVRDAIMAEGRLEFWRVAIKPGRPVALGLVNGIPLLGLPGNPVAALVTFSMLGRPLLARLAGAAHVKLPRFAVPSGFAYRKKLGRREYVRVQLGADGIARRYPKEGAGILTSLTESDALMELPEEMTELAPGELAPCIPMVALHG